MLNQRQVEILAEFYQHQGEYLTGNYFADKFSVSLRTIQGDIKTIKSEIIHEPSAELISKSSKGSCLQVIDHEAFKHYLKSLYQKLGAESLAYPENRLNQMLLFLLGRHRAIQFYELEDKFFVSHSTLLNDLKKLEEMLTPYGLEVMKSNNRVMIDGPEPAKRKLLAAQDLYMQVDPDTGDLLIDERNLTEIQDILARSFLEAGYDISESEFTNLSLFINIMVSRVQNGFMLSESSLVNPQDAMDFQPLATTIYRRLSANFFLRTNPYEVDAISVLLSGLGNHRKIDMISDHILDLVTEGLENIYQDSGTDLRDNLTLKTTLSLHCQSLLMRAQYGLQIQEDPIACVRETYTLGYELARHFVFILEQHVPQRITEAEKALLALHFYSALLDLHKSKAGKSVLVCSNQRKSLTVLLEQKLLKWFPGSIARIFFCPANEVTDSMLDEYDVFLTTEKNQFYEMGLAMLINPDLQENDYVNIKLNLDGFENIDSVINIFREDLYSTIDEGLKNEILHDLCTQASDLYGLEGFEKEVIKRESIGSTYFGHQTALAHPMSAVSSDTFVCVCFSKEPIIWDFDGNEVHLVMLLHVGKNNTSAFQLWNYVSKIFHNANLIPSLLKDASFENFKKLAKESFENEIRQH